MADLPPALARDLARVSAYDGALGDRLGLVFERVLRAADALTWSRERLPTLVAAEGEGELLQRVVDETRSLTDAPEVWAVTWSGDPTSWRVRFRALAAASTRGEPGRTADGELLMPDGLSRSIVGRVARERRPAWSDDALHDSRFQGAESVQAMALRSVGCLPLGEHGALYLYDPSAPGRFGATTRARLSALCALAGALLAAPTAPRGAPPEPLPGVVGDAPAMRALFASVRAFAPMPWPVLVLGETGTGKEAVARAIHDLSPRVGAPFVPVNCGTIPDELAESTLFGHERGAFTGADRRQDGLVDEVRGGTLFLDEVGELSPRVQVKLLRLLQEGTYTRVGETRERPFRGRVVAATLRPLDDPARRDAFREDLYHRLSACVVQVPPLRDRRADVPALAAHLLERALAELPDAPPLTLSPAALEALQRREWPGNVRELSNHLRRGVALALATGASAIEASHLVAGPAFGPAATATAPDVGALPADLQAATEAFQRRHVRAALERAGGNKTEAARILGVSRQWLHRLVARWEREGSW